MHSRTRVGVSRPRIADSPGWTVGPCACGPGRRGARHIGVAPPSHRRAPALQQVFTRHVANQDSQKLPQQTLAGGAPAPQTTGDCTGACASEGKQGCSRPTAPDKVSTPMCCIETSSRIAEAAHPGVADDPAGKEAQARCAGANTHGASRTNTWHAADLRAGAAGKCSSRRGGHRSFMVDPRCTHEESRRHGQRKHPHLLLDEMPRAACCAAEAAGADMVLLAQRSPWPSIWSLPSLRLQYPSLSARPMPALEGQGANFSSRFDPGRQKLSRCPQQSRDRFRPFQ